MATLLFLVKTYIEYLQNWVMGVIVSQPKALNIMYNSLWCSFEVFYDHSSSVLCLMAVVLEAISFMNLDTHQCCLSADAW